MSINENETGADLGNQPKRPAPSNLPNFDDEFDQRLKDLHQNDPKMQQDEAFRKKQFEDFHAFIDRSIPDEDAKEREAFHEILNSHEKEFQQADQQQAETPAAAGSQGPQVKMETITQKLIRLLQEAQQRYYDNIEAKKAEKEAKAAAADEKAEDKEEARADAIDENKKQMELEEGVLDQEEALAEAATDDQKPQIEARSAPEVASNAQITTDQKREEAQAKVQADAEQPKEDAAAELQATAPQPTLQPAAPVSTPDDELTELQKARDELELKRQQNEADFDKMESPSDPEYAKLSAEQAQIVNQVSELNTKIESLQAKSSAATPQPTPTPQPKNWESAKIEATERSANVKMGQGRSATAQEAPPAYQAPSAPTPQSSRSAPQPQNKPQLKPPSGPAPTPQETWKNIDSQVKQMASERGMRPGPKPEAPNTPKPKPAPNNEQFDLSGVMDKVRGMIPSHLQAKFDQIFNMIKQGPQANQQNNPNQQNTANPQNTANQRNIPTPQNTSNPNMMSLNQFHAKVELLTEGPNGLTAPEAQALKNVAQDSVNSLSNNTGIKSQQIGSNSNSTNALEGNNRLAGLGDNHEKRMGLDKDFTRLEAANKETKDAFRENKENQKRYDNQQDQTQSRTAKPS